MPRDNRYMYMAHVYFYVCCSDCVGVCGNVCCVAAVVKNSRFLSLGVLKIILLGLSSDHLPILIGLQTTATSSPARHRTYINLKKADCTGYRQEIERKLSSRHLPTDCQKDEKLFRATLLKAASHHITTG